MPNDIGSSVTTFKLNSIANEFKTKIKHKTGSVLLYLCKQKYSRDIRAG